MLRRLVVTLLLTSVLLFSGCASSKFIKPFDLEQFRELDGKAASADLAQLTASAAELKSFRSLMHVNLKRHDYREEFDQVVVFERPDRLRLEILSRELRRTLKLILINGKEAAVFDREQMELLRGKNNEETMQKLVGLPLRAEELMLLLAAQIDPGLRGKSDSVTGYVSPADSSKVLELEFENGQFMRVAYEMAGKSYRIKQIDLGTSATEILFRAEYRYGSGVSRVPAILSLWIADEEVLLNLRFDAPEVNPDLRRIEDRIFTFNPPPGAKFSDL